MVKASSRRNIKDMMAKYTMKPGHRFVFLLGVLICSALLVFILAKLNGKDEVLNGRLQGPEESVHAAIEVPGSSASSNSNYVVDHGLDQATHLLASPFKDVVPSVDRVTAHNLIGQMQTLEAGQVTISAIYEDLNTIAELGADALPNIMQLIEADAARDRLLGVYLFLYAYGYDADIKEMMKKEISPHIQAEVSKWLYQTDDFASYAEYVQAIATTLDGQATDQLLRVLNEDPCRMDVSATMDVLRMGESLEWFASHLASHSSRVADVLTEASLNDENGGEFRLRLFSILAHSKNIDFNAIMNRMRSGSADISSHLVVQNRYAEPLANRTESLAKLQNDIEIGLAGQGIADSDVLSSIYQYRDTLLLTGGQGAVNQDTLDHVLRQLESTPEHIKESLVHDLRYVAWAQQAP